MIRLMAVLLLLVPVTLARVTTACAEPPPPLPWVRFTSLDGPATVLDAYLFRPATPGPHPAVVFLHGCGGLVEHTTGPWPTTTIVSRELDWAARLTGAGYIVLMVDSFTARGVTGMCRAADYRPAVYAARPYDAYAALLYLQQMQPDVIPGRIGLMGWSEGGGALLDAIRTSSRARPSYLPQGDFQGAVAFYPARCNVRREGEIWASPVPLLVLIGAGDVWTPAEPCQKLIDSASFSRSLANIAIYPNAYHDFDWPNMKLLRRPAYTTAAGVVPIQGTDPAARADAFVRVPEFFGRTLMSR